MSNPTRDAKGLALLHSVCIPYRTEPPGVAAVWVAAWSPDSKQIAILAPERREVIFYDVATRSVLGDKGFAWSAGANIRVEIAWSPNGRYIALASQFDKKVDIYDLAARRFLDRFTTQTQITGVQFSSDNKRLWIGTEFAAPTHPIESYSLAQALDVATMRSTARAIAPIPMPNFRTNSTAANFQRLSGRTLLFSQIRSVDDPVTGRDGSWSFPGHRSFVSIFDVDQLKSFSEPISLVPDEGDTVVRPPQVMLMHPNFRLLVVLKEQGRRRTPHMNIPPETDKPLELYDLGSGRRVAAFGDLISLGGVFVTSVEYSASGERLFATCNATQVRPMHGASADQSLSGIYSFDGLQGTLQGSLRPIPARRSYLSPDGRYLAALYTEILHILAA